MRAREIVQRYAGAEDQLISPLHPFLQYEGRIDFRQEEGPLWTYPATSVRLRFRGSSIGVVVSNFHAYWENYLGYLLDGREYCVRLNEEGVTCLQLYAGPDMAGQDRVHELLLFKRQDSCHMVQIHGFIGSRDLELLPCERLPERRIEVYGDSVSAGEVSEAVAYCGEPDPEHNGEYSNSYYSYAWLTARRLGARLHDIAQGGIALMDGIGYFMEPQQQGMETIFDRIQYQPYLMEKYDSIQPARWDFTRYRPQVVIVAVGQNDAHPVDFCAQDYDGEEAKEWRNRYAAFVRRLRKIHPQAQIICLTTILGHHENWDRSIDEVCARLQDPKVHHFLFSQNGCGTKGHIRKPEAEKMAEELAGYIGGLGENIWRDTGRLEQTMARAAAGEPLTLGFLGGSITQGSLATSLERCYASLVTKWWRKTYPQAEITAVNAGIGGTTSHFGVARAEADLLFARPDVVFVEFSVNDDENGHFQETYEGLVRRLLSCSWKPAVVLLHNRFYDDGHSAEGIHDSIGAYYGLPRVCMGDEIYPRIAAGELPLDEVTPDGLHPNDKGHELLAQLITAKLAQIEGWRKADGVACREADSPVGEREIQREEAKSQPETGKLQPGMGKPQPEAGRLQGMEGWNPGTLASDQLPLPLTANRYEHAVRLRNSDILPSDNQGFLPDPVKQDGITDVFRCGWRAGRLGAELTFEIDAACAALQYRKTIRKPAPVAVAIVDGEEENPVVLDGNFDETWGDCLFLQTLFEEDQSRRHTITVRITECRDIQTEFYLVSLIVA